MKISLTTTVKIVFADTATALDIIKYRDRMQHAFQTEIFGKSNVSTSVGIDHDISLEQGFDTDLGQRKTA